MRKEAKMVLERSTDSLVLAIERFNGPWDRGRQEVTLLLLDRAFELLLKAAILHKGRKIRENGAKETFGNDKCVRVCLSDKRVSCITDEQALTLQVINSLRDAAQHYMLEVSEEQRYLYAQAGLTLFADLPEAVLVHRSVITSRLAYCPFRYVRRAIFIAIVKAEFEGVKCLIAPGSRKHLEARARLRALAVVEASLNGVRSQPGEAELKTVVSRIKEEDSWQKLFPGVASSGLSTETIGQMGVATRLTKEVSQ